MGGELLQRSHAEFWQLTERQHGVITRGQLLDLGFSSKAIEHRIARGRLHRLRPGIYAVGRPVISQRGRWIAAVLSCGPLAVLSHTSAAALWGILPMSARPEVSVPSHVLRRPAGIVVHRRVGLSPADIAVHDSIPVTTPISTLVDIATQVDRDRLEAAVNEADRRALTDPERLRAALDELPPRRPGAGALRTMLDRRTFVLTDSALERRFLRIVRNAGLSRPETGRYLNGFKVDFHWPDLGLVVETDGLRYHRTPAQQTRDRMRDQAHTAAGLTPLRFTHAQVRFEPDRVQSTLLAVASRLEGLTR